MIQELVTFLTCARLELITVLTVFVAVFFAVLSGWKIPWPDEMWEKFEFRYVRPLAERRGAFLKGTFALFLFGCWAASYQVRYGGDIGKLLVDLTAISLAALGFFFTIYGLRGVLDRPRDLDEVLLRAAEMINERKDRKNQIIVLFCEYPAWGALSLQDSDAYGAFCNSLTSFIAAGAQNKIVLVSPNDQGMQARIKSYAYDYGRTESQLASATEANTKLMNALDGAGGLTPKGFKRWKIRRFPRYQALLLGEGNSSERRMRPLQAIVWLSPRSSDVDNTTNGQQDVASDAKPVPEEHVQVLAWQTAAPDMLCKLFDSAYFYTRWHCEGTPALDYMAFFE